MNESDLMAADELRRLAGWNQTLDDWRHMLRLEPGGCFLALQESRVVGSVTTTTYGQSLAWIGMMLVHPDYRRQGIGLALMRQALSYLQGRGVKCIKLDATPAGYPLYEKLGFVPEWSMTRWQRMAEAGPLPSVKHLPELRDLQDGDWCTLDQLDADLLGASRSRLLRSLKQRARTALASPARGQVTSWGLLRPGAIADYLGPLEVSEPGAATNLVTALLHAPQNPSVFWDLPDANQIAQNIALECGFMRVRPLTRMRLGPGPATKDLRRLFAIADPAVG